MIQAVIMAGGKGTRVLALTKDELPKPMLPVAGKPILEWQILSLREQGVLEFVFIIGHLGHKIREYFQDGADFGVHIEYIEEAFPMKTAGALSMLPPLLKCERFLLIFGDVIFDIDISRMLEYHAQHQSKATLFVHPNMHPFDSDLVECDSEGRVVRFDSKHNTRDYWYHNCVNAGLYLFENSVCDIVPPNTAVDLEKDLLAGMIVKGEAVYGYNSPEYIRDVGTIERIEMAEKDIKSGLMKARCLRNKQKAIFIDRDGTINCKNGLVFKPEQLNLEQCAVTAIQKINQSGYLAIVITNQPVVARGLCGLEDVETINKKMETLLGEEGAYLDGIFYCPHHPDKGYPEENPDFKIKCNCRKPAIGMIEESVERFNLNIDACWMVGDTTVDIQTGINAGINSVLVLTGDAGTDRKFDVSPTITCKDLEEAVYEIVKLGKR